MTVLFSYPLFTVYTFSKEFTTLDAEWIESGCLFVHLLSINVINSKKPDSAYVCHVTCWRDFKIEIKIKYRLES